LTKLTAKSLLIKISKNH